MKKTLLFAAITVFLTLNAGAQNLLLNGDFEEQGIWEIIQEEEGTVSFGNADNVPVNGSSNCLYITDKSPESGWEQETFIYQKVTLEVGKTYEFSGALKSTTNITNDPKFWIEIIMMPVDGWDMNAERNPNWEKWGCPSSAVFKVTQADENWSSIDNTFNEIDDTKYIGAFTGVFHSERIYGDTTIFTVPSQYPTSTGFEDLGPDGTKVEFFFILYTGVGPQHNDFEFAFDEFELKEYEPAENLLANGDFEEQGAWERLIKKGNENALSLEFGNTTDTPKYGKDGCLLITWEDSTAMKQFLMQQITLKVGETYKFRGAIKDAGTVQKDLSGWWYGIMMWPAVEDQTLNIDSVRAYGNLYAGPEPNGGDYSSATMLSMGNGFHPTRFYDIDTLFGPPLNPIVYGDLVGRNDSWKGDTTYYTVPAVMQRFTDILPLGEIGDEINYWFIINLGQYGAGQHNVKYSMDEFSLVKVDDVTSPDCAITSDASDVTNSAFTVTFNFKEAVVGFDISDIIVGNGTVSNFKETATSTIWTADITPSNEGEVTVDVAGNSATDASGNGNNAAEQFKINYVSTGINESTFGKNILVYPNPSNGIINLRIDNNDNNIISLSLIDITGRKVWQNKIAGLQINEPVNLTSVGKGYYFLRISTQKATATKSIIIE